MNSLLTAEVRSWNGREVTYTAPEELGRASIRYFAHAIGDENPIYTDPDSAQRAGYEDVIAPPTLICETNQHMTGSRDDDGYLGHTWGLEVQGTRLIRGGNEYEFYQPVYPSDQITVTWRITDISERTTSHGLSMLIVPSEASYVNQRGERLARNRETLIYQELSP